VSFKALHLFVVLAVWVLEKFMIRFVAKTAAAAQKARSVAFFLSGRALK